MSAPWCSVEGEDAGIGNVRKCPVDWREKRVKKGALWGRFLSVFQGAKSLNSSPGRRLGELGCANVFSQPRAGENVVHRLADRLQSHLVAGHLLQFLLERLGRDGAVVADLL